MCWIRDERMKERMPVVLKKICGREEWLLYQSSVKWFASLSTLENLNLNPYMLVHTVKVWVGGMQALPGCCSMANWLPPQQKLPHSMEWGGEAMKNNSYDRECTLQYITHQKVNAWASLPTNKHICFKMNRSDPLNVSSQKDLTPCKLFLLVVSIPI